MGAIQSSFNQLLGIGAIATKAVGSEIAGHKQESIALKHEEENIVKDISVAEKKAQELETKKAAMDQSGVDKRTKAYRSLVREMDNMNVQIKEFAERRKSLYERATMEESRFRKGLFGTKSALKKIDTYNKEVDAIVGGNK